MEWKPDLSACNAQAGDIKALRKKLSLSQRQFAKRLGVSKRSVIRWENGNSAPTVVVRLQLERIAEEVTDLEGDTSEGDTFEGDTFEGDKSKVTDVTPNSQEKVTGVTSNGNNLGNNPESGNNSNFSKAAQDIQVFDGKGNIYFTLNPVNPDLLARTDTRGGLAPLTFTAYPSSTDFFLDIYNVMMLSYELGGDKE